MSVPSLVVPRGAASPGRSSAAPKHPPWGFLELIALTPTIYPALMYIPGAFAIRTPLRIADFSTVLIVWMAVLFFRKNSPVGRPFVPSIILAGCVMWLTVLLIHPTTNSPISGTAQVVLLTSIMCPAFWVPKLQISPDRLTRMLRLIFFANLLSALWGVGQIYMPDRFNPPDFGISMRGDDQLEDRTMTTSSGRKVVRLCGLTDSVGGAANAAANVVIIGLIWSLQPMAFWRKLVLFGLVFLAMGVMYMSQVRIMVLTSVGSLAVTAGVLALRRDFTKATFLTIGLGLVVAGALGWVAFVGGEEATKRFTQLLDDGAAETYQKNRGGFLQKTFERDIPNYPLGAGLGRWGQIYFYFGNKKDPFGVGRGELWSEIQMTAWVYDGGVPLLVGYSAAIAIAMWSAFSIALHGFDPKISYAACIVFATGLALMVATLGSMPFIGPLGVQFWLLTTSLHVANEQAGVAARRARYALLKGAS